jgi:type II secretory ATPase GspE/PulE/Tfp pilus assembly ATPase PilB-like protein
VQYCNRLLHFAVSLRASDLHLEPREDALCRATASTAR